MKTTLNVSLATILMALLVIVPSVTNGQNKKTVIKKYLTELTPNSVNKTLQKYRMTAIYTNRDLYGTFIDKTKVTGDYTIGLNNGFVNWNNVSISNSKNYLDDFPEGIKQEYMENITYVPSPKILDPQTFKDFPENSETVFSRNLIWDMYAIEEFAWNYTDSLELNKTYRIPKIKGKFDMADIGTYAHTEIQLCWTGISAIDNSLFAVIEFRALDNKVEITMPGVNMKGTEQYWGTVWISLKNKLIGRAVMYSGTIQELKMDGFDTKFIIKTIRELWVDKIQ
ncbi:hypothetical protein [Lutibacter sp. B1]|uniref:hypothetical protein n=1 Tax=Lutibacter sp. B1 TaxID=2725996 RepID=UPI001456AFAE|nr:hypothetical protein [Lutibacter sp. B1]NLP56922.1 hypothetical protein [Lutibacter sp. B1]